jgi:hypothetical protein
VECRAGTILFGHYPVVDGGTVQIFLLWFCRSGYGTVEMVRWVVCLSFHFLQFAVSSPGVRLSVVGFCSSISICSFWLYSGTICGFVFYKLLIFSYLLQMVEEEFGPGRL